MSKRTRRKPPTTIRLNDSAKEIAERRAADTGQSTSRTISMLVEIAEQALRHNIEEIKRWQDYVAAMHAKHKLRQATDQKLRAIDAELRARRAKPEPRPLRAEKARTSA